MLLVLLLTRSLLAAMLHLRHRWLMMILLGLCSGLLAATATAAGPEDCKAQFQANNPMKLCHNASETAGNQQPRSCDEGKGFVLTTLVLAPLPFYDDCNRYHVRNLYDAQCLRNMTREPERDRYDRIIFDILDKVSGQNQVPPSTVVDRFPLTVEKGGEEVQSSTAFVAFKKRCKSADPEKMSDIINLCSNSTVMGTFLHLTLRGLTSDLPQTPSMCRCVLRPNSHLKLLALDVRLQNAGDRRCGRSSLKIETNGTTKEDIRCHGMSALYGNHELYNSESSEEVTLTLTYISQEQIPTSVWIDAQDTYGGSGDVMSISCGGFIPLPKKEPEDKEQDSSTDDDDQEGEGDDDDGGDENGEEKPEASEAGVDLIVILPTVLGILFVVIVIVIVIIVIKRRRSGGHGGLLLPCSRCRDKDDDDPIFYKPVAMQEPVYAEPGKPRPSTTTPYVFPADAKLPVGRSEYAEPDPNGTLAMAVRGASPPPIPEQPPPSSPPMFPPGTPPPKPERTLLRQRKESAKSNASEGEDYDHIVAGGKSPRKPSQGRDGQNNIIRDEEGEGMTAEGNVYDHLQHGDDYSELGNNPKQQVKDNVYDTTA